MSPERKELYKRMTGKEWDSALKAGEIKVVTPVPDTPKGFLTIYQVFKGYVKYNDKYWRVIGWAPPGSKPYVELREITNGTFKVKEAEITKS